jgi:hypothetical protein
MVKIKLYGIGNDEEFNVYTFDKKQKVAEYLSMILGTLFGINWEFEDSEFEKINIEGYKDLSQTIASRKGFHIHVFYGDKKMFLTINCSEKDRLKFNEVLFKVVEIPKPQKNKIPKGLKK